ncbi:g12195 [Coccomyxa viridis]|uniref:General transcription factor TFIIB n=1 Tax=Coccomyxa viridis TaxID=1274662 RepID=A0ABP1GE19_9CHLO
MDAARYKFEQQCADCGSSDFVEDHANGDLVCTNCGLVAESHLIDEGSEWRSFGDKEKGDHGDPSRVGGPTNHLLSSGGLGTEIGVATKGTGNITMIRNLQRTAARASDPDQGLKRAYAHINKLSGALGLQKDASSRACELYKKAAEHPKGLKGKSTSAMCAAVVYVACRQAGYARTFKEVQAVVADAGQKEIAKCYKFLVNVIKEKVEMVTPASLVRRFCAVLGLGVREMKAAEEMARAAVPSEGSTRPEDSQLRPWDGKSPASVAGAVIYAISSLPKAEKHCSALEIAQAAAVAEGTVKGTYRDMYVYMAELMPAWYASKKELQNLPNAP